MSMDAIVWATCLLNVPADLPQPDLWKKHNIENSTYWSFQAPTYDWQLVLEDPNDLSVPDSIKQRDPKIKIAYALTLEPIGAPVDGHKLQIETINKILKLCGGGLVQSYEGLQRYDKDGELAEES